MAIRYVGFCHPIPCGSQGSLSYWSEDKHGRTISVSEKGSWLTLTLEDGSRRRVPLVNVSCVHEDDAPAKPMKVAAPVEAA